MDNSLNPLRINKHKESSDLWFDNLKEDNISSCCDA